ncbi:MAG: two component transcriptional regulator, sensor histidine kinase [Micavibrio sp.]|nr:two component transcriptional regulator, sensor histidine kinase [Micavibrio sp.]
MLKKLMNLSDFIKTNMDSITAEWLNFAKTMEPAATTMSTLALADHAKPILLAIAKDLEQEQTAQAQYDKSKGKGPRLSAAETAAATHGALRHLSGFDMIQLGAEYRALRASVVRLWAKENTDPLNPAGIEDMVRFNEAVDQAVAESTARYAAEVALSRDTFVAILAHDLRSPLSAISMIGQLLERTATSENARAQAGQIQRSAQEMSGMIRDLLEYTRTHLGKGIPVEPKDENISVICRAALEEVRSGNPHREFLLNVPEKLTGFVDTARIRQAISNLLNNAIQHGDPRSAITLSAYVENNQLALSVKNMGKPIPPESLQVIFDPLVQLSDKSAIKVDVTSTNLGLGLFIAREVAIGHSGNIDVKSTLEEGTVFTIRVPQTSLK